MKLLCKKDYKPISFQKGLEYKVEMCSRMDSINQINIKIYTTDIEGGYVHVNKTLLNEHFYTEKETRKFKLKKLNEIRI